MSQHLPDKQQREEERSNAEELFQHPRTGDSAQIVTSPANAELAAPGIFDETFACEYVELFYQYSEPQIVDASAFEQAFGLRATPLDEAFHTTVGWYRERSRA